MTTRRGAGAALRRRWGTVAVLLAVTVVGGCSSNADSAAESVPYVAEDSAESAEAAAADTDGLDAVVGGAEEDRAVIVNGSIVLTADEPITVAEAVVTAVEGAGGYLDGRSESEGRGSSPASARLTVRLPPGEVQAMIDSLRGIGDVTSVELTSSDVTKQVADLDTRISAKKVAITRLEELLSGAGSMADLLAVEGELTTRQSELEQLLTEQAGIDDLTSMATIEISVYATDDAPQDEDEVEGFLGGLSAGWAALVTALGAAVTVIGVLLPWLAVVGLVGAVVLWALRRRRPAVDGSRDPRSQDSRTSRPQAAQGSATQAAGAPQPADAAGSLSEVDGAPRSVSDDAPRPPSAEA